MIYLNSFSTPEEGISGEVVFVATAEDLTRIDVTNKIVYTHLRAGYIYPRVFTEKDALGLITYNNPDYLNSEKNTSSIQFRSLPYREDLKPWAIALSYQAKKRLDSALEKGKVILNTKIKTKIYPSEELTVVATIKGSEVPYEQLVLSAHVQEPGANDNATGVGTQLEMAQVLAKLLKEEKLTTKRTITFLWGDEIVSTQRYIKEDSSRRETIKWGISLDMVGENTSLTGGSFLIEKMPDPSAIWTRGDDKHSEWGGEVMTLNQMKPHYLNDFIIHTFSKQGEFANWEVNTNPFEGGSDHTPFLDANIPGLLLWHFTDQFYHTDNDRLDKVSQTTMKNVGTAALAAILTLVNGDSNTGLDLVTILERAALTRLDAESKLSQEIVLENGSVQSQIDILKAWGDWYVKSLATIKDIDPASSENLEETISNTQQAIQKRTETAIEKLKAIAPTTTL